MNKESFYKGSRATFTGCKRPTRKPDYISYNRYGEISSEYWYSDDGVYRASNHWSSIFLKRKKVEDIDNCFSCLGVATCWWELRTTKISTTCGFCKWTAFRRNKIH